MAELEKKFPTIFGLPRNNGNVVIAVDTSGSMYNKLDSVKTHLIEFLLDLATHENVSFNLIEFNSEIRCWADKMVVCNQNTVEVAIPWIKTLGAKTGTNTLDALITAFENDCDCVYLVTDGLPDQHPFDILDEVVYTGNHKPVHCIYLTGESSDAAAIRFLENLATETHGSFVMASVVRYGCMEKITPVYVANHSEERMVRTVQGSYQPTTSKHCSVTTSLVGDPLLYSHPLVAYNGLVHPYYYHPYWWTRYHTAKSFMRSAEKQADRLVVSNMGVSPSAAMLLIGQKVVARREEDGYYYPGTVNSQLSTEAFLVEFHATDVGDYRETKYQETAIYDIISFTDALRHPVIPGDRVLAPSANGNYRPAIVIAGMEYRGSNAGGLDSPITVSFSDGRTRDLPPNSAIWIPGSLYDRISLEINVPSNARKPLKSVEGYPSKSLPGYPRSGTYPFPFEYHKLYPSVVDCGDVLLDSTWFGWPQFVGVHSAMYKPKSAPPVCVKASDLEKKIEVKVEEPKEEVKEEVNEEAVEEVKQEEVVEEVQEEATEETEQATEEVKEEDKPEDTMTDEEYQKLLEELVDFETTRYVYPRPKRPQSAYVPWKTHWHNDGIPPLVEPNRPGPFRDTVLRVPMELREHKIGESGAHNPNSQFFSTKSGRVPGRHETNIYRMSVLPGPQPPSNPPPKQGPAVDFSTTLGEAQRQIEEKDRIRRDFRRHCIVQREDHRVRKMMEEEKMTRMMRDQHRDRILERAERERALLEAERDAVFRLRETKRQLATDIREKEVQRALKDQDRELHRLDARRAAQLQRAEMEARKRMEDAERAQKERAAKEARCQQRWQQRHDELEDGERQRLLREAHLRGVKVGRRERFRLLEAQGQRNKEIKATVFKDNQAVFQSAIY